MSNTCDAGVPSATRLRSAGGISLWPTEIEVANHCPPKCRTDSEPGRVSTEPMSWSTWVPGDRRAFWMSEALAKA
jgi:hypothetical protein